MEYKQLYEDLEFIELEEYEFEKVSPTELDEIITENHIGNEYGYTLGTLKELNDDRYEVYADGFLYNDTGEMYTDGNNYVFLHNKLKWR